MKALSRIKNIEEVKRLLQDQKLAQMKAIEDKKALSVKQPTEQSEAQQLSDLFKSAVKDARPLNTDRIHHNLPKPKPVPQQFIRDEKQALVDSLSDGYFPSYELESGEELLYLREGQSPSVLSKLRRGHWVVQANLDLHGMISEEARVTVSEFLAGCKKRGIRCVRIVHGKGLGSRNKEPILKNKLRYWLMQKDEVIAYAQARINDGGGGAVLVLLKA
jgi:DNA-nicking Smr family endonuclease